MRSKENSKQETTSGRSSRPSVHASAAGEYFTEERCYILELSNRADDPAVSIARARVTPGVATKRHRVIGTEERYVILQGTGLVSVGKAALREVSAGDVVRIPAGVEQSIFNRGHTDLIFLCICTPRFERRNYESLE
jgi:mannose-6-phosphate isomerase-like protein (cupin superfamily)